MEFYPEWAVGLTGIEEFSHLVVVLFMDRVEPRRPDEPLTHQVESLDGMPEVSLFGMHSPRRLKPLGLCYPRPIGREGNPPRVSGLDGWPGTPVLDIKGYYVGNEPRGRTRPRPAGSSRSGRVTTRNADHNRMRRSPAGEPRGRTMRTAMIRRRAVAEVGA